MVRIDREVVTERDLFNCHGTFYELPAENAGGFAKVRPISTHNRKIADYCSYRGLLVMTGISAAGATATSSARMTARRPCGSARWMISGSSARPWDRAGPGRIRQSKRTFFRSLLDDRL